jgi:outer membrane protein OmpU
MKQILLASTALVAFAGAAAAEVAISGSGRMGMVYDKSIVNDNLVRSSDGKITRASDAGFRFDSRVRVAFTLTQETDSGVTFGGTVRADNASAGNNGKGGSVFMSGAFGKLSMGDVDGAAESAVGNLSGVGYTGLGDFNEAFYLQQGNSDLNGNDKVSEFATPAALYEYTTGAASFYFSLGNPGGIAYNSTFFNTVTLDLTTEKPDDKVTTVKVEDIVIDQAYGIGAKYSVDNYSFGIGYESINLSGVVTRAGDDGKFGDVKDTAGPDGLDFTDDDTTAAPSDDVVTEYDNTIDNWILGGSATWGGFTLKAQYGEGSGENLDLTQYGISGDYTFDAFTVTAFWRSVELKNADDTRDTEYQPFGVGVSYDLGGGASVAAGVVDPDILGEDYRADVGVNFNF